MSYNESAFQTHIANEQVAIIKKYEALERALPDSQTLYDNVLETWGSEGRYIRIKDLRTDKGFWFPEDVQWNGDDIIFVPPGSDYLPEGKVTLSDALNKHGKNSESGTGEANEGIGYSSINIQAFFKSPKFLDSSEEIRKESLADLIGIHPDKEEEILKMHKAVTGSKDIQELVKAGTYGQDTIQAPVETPTVSSPSLLSPDNANSSMSVMDKWRRGAGRMGEDISQTSKNNIIKKAEKYLENPGRGFTSPLFSKWVEETKGMEAYKIKKEDKPEAVEEFLDFLNQ